MFMMTRTAFLLLLSGWKRFFAVICLIALLSLTAGLLGTSVLYSDGVPEPIGIAVVNLDNSLESRLMLSVLLEQDMGALLQIAVMNEWQAHTALMEGEVSAVFTLPEGFMRSVMSGQNHPIQAVYNPATPMRSALVQNMADSMLELLRISQIGVYTALEYSANYAPEFYDEVFQRINMRYITLAASSGTMFHQNEISATGALPPITHYLVHALIFLYTLSLMIIIPLIRESFPREVKIQLRQLGFSKMRIAAGWTLALWLWLMLGMVPLTVLYFAAAQMFALPIWAAGLIAVPIVALYLAALAALLGLMPISPLASGATLCLYASGSLAISGGVLPLSFLPMGIGRIAQIFPSYHAARLLGNSLHGEILMGAVLAVLLTGFVLVLCQAAAIYFKGGRP